MDPMFALAMDPMFALATPAGAMSLGEAIPVAVEPSERCGPETNPTAVVRCAMAQRRHAREQNLMETILGSAAPVPQPCRRTLLVLFFEV